MFDMHNVPAEMASWPLWFGVIRLVHGEPSSVILLGCVFSHVVAMLLLTPQSQSRMSGIKVFTWPSRQGWGAMVSCSVCKHSKLSRLVFHGTKQRLALSGHGELNAKDALLVHTNSHGSRHQLEQPSSIL